MDAKKSASRSHNDPPSTGPALPVGMFNVGKQTVFCRIDRPKCQGNAFCLYNVYIYIYNHISWFLYHYHHVCHHRSTISCLKGLGNRPSCPVEGLCTIQLILSVDPRLFDQQIETKCRFDPWTTQWQFLWVELGLILTHALRFTESLVTFGKLSN